MTPGDGRYAGAAAALVERLEPLFPGIGIVVVPSAQHALIAGQLAPRMAAQVVALDEATARTPGLPRIVVPGLPADRAKAAQLLALLNGRRDFITTHGALVVLLVSSFELTDVQRHAPDLYSARLFLEEVRFEPDQNIDVEAARASLARYYGERFGRLDLRGFIRSEAEDVSFSVEEIFQEMSAATISQADLPQGGLHGGELPVREWLRTLPRDLPIVLLAHPGSGKTFLLRWLSLAATSRPPTVGVAEAPLPLLVSLAAYAQAPQPMTLLEYAEQMLLRAGEPAAHLVERAVAERQAVFLLDGVDEAGDEAARRHVLRAIRELQQQAPSCRIIATSRFAGYEPGALEAHQLVLSSFTEDEIRGFLVRWCELYAVARLGSSDAARNAGREEGHRLAADVLGNPGVRSLAGNPLLLTVLAIVHRAGVRLPDHRVELYAHATRVLVERWNRVRSLAGAGAAAPLKAVDAVRLLGPLALRMIEHGASTVSEETLRTHVEQALATGTFRGVSGAEEVISLFRDALGLLVEQAPGTYAFLHLTLAEYFAAWELVRSDALERLAAHPKRAYLARHREILLLAAGELGVLRGDDGRLDRLAQSLVESAGRRPGRPSPGVPSLLAGLLADDPHLSTSAAERLVNELIPAWWFERSYESRELSLVAEEALSLLGERIMHGRFGALIKNAAQRAYEGGFPEEVFDSLARSRSSNPWLPFITFLRITGVDYGPHILRCLASSKVDPDFVAFILLRTSIARVGESSIHIRFRASRHLDERARADGIPIGLNIALFVWTGSGGLFDVESHVLPWNEASRTDEQTDTEVTLEVEVSRQKPLGEAPFDARVRLWLFTAAPAAPRSIPE
ncbi:NACHT domain-containing protein [Sorangium sp. So ce131]|uniref:NACHT domain-containing protein n=1 Tax=Sorangium sp. So ce131 TaxID=3133282 RepID=UPI003F649016